MQGHRANTVLTPGDTVTVTQRLLLPAGGAIAVGTVCIIGRVFDTSGGVRYRLDDIDSGRIMLSQCPGECILRGIRRQPTHDTNGATQTELT